MSCGDASYAIYIHVFPNEKMYVGITAQPPTQRWKFNGHGYDRQPAMKNAIRKYGWENVEHYILLDGLTREEAEFLETEMIDAYGSADRKYGYNVQLGGGVHGRHSEQTRDKMRASHLGEKNHRFGKPMNDKTRVAFERYNKQRRKTVICIETGEVFPSIRAAASAIGCTKTNIARALKSGTANGKHFVYGG